MKILKKPFRKRSFDLMMTNHIERTAFWRLVQASVLVVTVGLLPLGIGCNNENSPSASDPSAKESAEGVDIEAIEYRVREIRASRWRKFPSRGRWCPKTAIWNLPNEDRVSIWASRRSGWCHLNRSSYPLLARNAYFHLFVLSNPPTQESPVYAS